MTRLNKSAVGRAVLFFLAAAVLTAGTVSAQAPRNKKLVKQITIMERVLDGVLVESPYFLVSSRDPAHGIYLDEFGVLFTMEASLLDRDHDNDWWEGLKRWKYERKDGQIIIHRPDDADEDEDPGEWRERKLRRDSELYEGGREELVEALVDYGETLRALDDDHWVAIAAFLKDSEYFMDNKMSRLVLKVRMRDLRAHEQGKLSAGAVRDRIGIEEY